MIENVQATSLDGFLTLRENDDMLDAMAPSRDPYTDEDGLFDSEPSEEDEDGPHHVRGGGLLSRFGFGRAGDKGNDYNTDPEGSGDGSGSVADSDGSGNGSSSNPDGSDDSSEVVMSDVSACFPLISVD